MINLLDLASEEVAYAPDILLDAIIKQPHIKKMMRHFLERLRLHCQPLVKFRRLPIGSSLFIRMHEVTN